MVSRIKAVGDLTFGARPNYSSSRSAEYERTDDRRSFMIRFDPALAAAVGDAGIEGVRTTRASIGTRTYAAVIPASGRDVDVAFVVNGFAVTGPGTAGRLVLVVNGETLVTPFAAGLNGDAFTASLRYRAKAVNGIRLAVLLIAERSEGDPAEAAAVAINDISADAALKRRR
jgi:hypothetical protein